MKTLAQLIVVLSLVLPSVTAAQVNFGIKAGLNFSNASFDYADADPVLRVNAGIVSEINLGKNFLVKPELLYSAKGWKATDISVTLNYISLPLLAGCRLIPDHPRVNVIGIVRYCDETSGFATGHKDTKVFLCH